MIIGCNEARINKIIKKEINKERLQECLGNKEISEAIRHNDMQLLFDNLIDDYTMKDLIKIVPLLVMILMAVREKISANKLLEYASEHIWNVPIYYMEIDILEVTASFIPRLIGCSVGKLIIDLHYNFDGDKLSEIINKLSLKKCKIQKLDITYREDEKEYFDMTEEEVREYVKSEGGEINIIE